MKKTILTLAFCLVSSLIFAQSNLYEHPEFDQITSSHELVAILPFRASVSLRPKEMKKITADQLAEMEESNGLSIQSGLYSWFLKREKSTSSKISFLDPATTNEKLQKAGISYETFEEYTPTQLAGILGVDEIIMGTFETNSPMSLTSSLAMGLVSGIYGSTNQAKIDLSIFNSSDGLLLLNYKKEVNGPWDSSTDDVIDMLMRRASKRISYTE